MRIIRLNLPTKYCIRMCALLISTIFLTLPALAEGATTSTEIQVQYNLNALPEKTRETLLRIITAAKSGDLEELRTALEWNELPPETGADNKTDPISFWKKQSSGGNAH